MIFCFCFTLLASVERRNSNIRAELLSQLKEQRRGLVDTRDNTTKGIDNGPMQSQALSQEAVNTKIDQTVSSYKEDKEDKAESVKIRRMLKRKRKRKRKRKKKKKKRRRRSSKFGIIGTVDMGARAVARKRGQVEVEESNGSSHDDEPKKKRRRRRRKHTSSGERYNSTDSRDQKRKKDATGSSDSRDQRRRKDDTGSDDSRGKRKKDRSSNDSQDRGKGSKNVVVVAAVNSNSNDSRSRNSSQQTDSQNTRSQSQEDSGNKEVKTSKRKEEPKYEDERTKFLEDALNCFDVRDVDDLPDLSAIPKCVLNNLDDDFVDDVPCKPDKEDFLYNVNYRLKVLHVDTEQVNDRALIYFERLMSIGDTAEFAAPINQLCFFKINKSHKLTIVYPDRVAYTTMTDIINGNKDVTTLNLKYCKVQEDNLYDSAVWRFHVGKGIIGAAIRLMSNCMYIENFEMRHVEFMDQFTPRLTNFELELRTFCDADKDIMTREIYPDIYHLSAPAVKKLNLKDEIKPGDTTGKEQFEAATASLVEHFYGFGNDEIGIAFDGLLMTCRESLKRLFKGPGVYTKLYPHKPFTFNTKLLPDIQYLTDLVFTMYDIAESVSHEYEIIRPELKVDLGFFAKIGSFFTGDDYQEKVRHCELSSDDKKAIKKDDFKKAQNFEFYDSMINFRNKWFGKCMEDVMEHETKIIKELVRNHPDNLADLPEPTPEQIEAMRQRAEVKKKADPVRLGSSISTAEDPRVQYSSPTNISVMDAIFHHKVKKKKNIKANREVRLIKI